MAVRFTNLPTLLVAMLLSGLIVISGGCGERAAIEDTTRVPEPDEVGEPDQPPDVEQVEAGQQAYEFTAPLAGGGEASLSDYEGKILVLDFWATWCASCVAELPEYQRLYDSWDREQVEYLGLSSDPDVSTIEAFLQGRPELTLPMALADNETVDAFLGARRTLPSSRVIDREGFVRYEFTGPAADRVAVAVETLLAEDEAPATDAEETVEQ